MSIIVRHIPTGRFLKQAVDSAGESYFRVVPDRSDATLFKHRRDAAALIKAQGTTNLEDWESIPENRINPPATVGDFS